MNPMNIAKMMKQAQEMQARMQETVKDIEVTQSVAGGMVEVAMSGDKLLTKVTIDPELLDPQDPQMVQDLVLSAVNEAARQVDEQLKGAMGGLAAGMGLPGMPGL